MISLAKSLNPEVMKCTKLLNLLACRGFHLVDRERVCERDSEREREREREREQLQAVRCLAIGQNPSLLQETKGLGLESCKDDC